MRAVENGIWNKPLDFCISFIYTSYILDNINNYD